MPSRSRQCRTDAPGRHPIRFSSATGAWPAVLFPLVVAVIGGGVGLQFQLFPLYGATIADGAELENAGRPARLGSTTSTSALEKQPRRSAQDVSPPPLAQPVHTRHGVRTYWLSTDIADQAAAESRANGVDPADMECSGVHPMMPKPTS